MQQLQHQMMGYDRAAAMFTPDGRLLQVEYARKTVNRVSMVIGITYKDGVLLLADKRVDEKLIDPDSVKKIHKLTNNIIAGLAGHISDGRALIETLRIRAQQNKLRFGEDIDVYSIVKEVCDIKHGQTLYGGVRPFGVFFLIAGKDQKGHSLYMTDPSGIFFKYKAKAMGAGQVKANEILEAEYKDNLSEKDALSLATKALVEGSEKEIQPDKLEALSIKKSIEDISQLAKELVSKYPKPKKEIKDNDKKPDTDEE